jgi:hypothetical protein
VFAAKIVNGRPRDLARAVAPALTLNAVMLAVMSLTHWALTAMGTVHPIIYMTCIGVTGGISYAVAFLTLPIKDLEAEAARWWSRIKGSVDLIPPFRRR